MHTISPPRKVHYKESKETKGINCTGQKDWDGIQIDPKLSSHGALGLREAWKSSQDFPASIKRKELSRLS